MPSKNRARGDSAEGNSGVAAELGISVETVRKWRSRFTKSGTAGLADAARPGRRKADLVLTGAGREQLWCEIVSLACDLLARTQVLALAGETRRCKQERTTPGAVEPRPPGATAGPTSTADA